MPMWCSSSDTPKPPGYTQAHHRIVRIPPGESVVLNSAERAPYLLLVEILNEDLDFQPTKRSNREVLKKIVVKEDERKGTSSDLIPFANSFNSRHQHKQVSVNDSDLVFDTDSSRLSISQIDKPSLVQPHDDEEIDLVEQLYGSDHSLLRAVDLSDSIVLPAAPKNKELDMAAWSRSSSVPPTPAVENGLLSVQIHTARTVDFPSPLSTPSTESEGDAHMIPPMLSLDEYSERMRTAAIMLAQLNSNLRELVTPIPQSGPSKNQQSPRSKSCFADSKWLGDSDNSSLKGANHPSGPEHPTYRMKLQQTEAAAIRDRIMQEMLALEEQRMQRMRENHEKEDVMSLDVSGSIKSAEDEGIIRRELNKADPSAVVFSESWATKKVEDCNSTKIKDGLT